MFSGEQLVTLDDKGRIVVPVRYREDLGVDTVMWRGIEGQVMVYPKQIWQQAVDRLAQQETRQRIRQAKWVLFSGNPVEVDRQGRVVIPSSLRRHAELGSDVVIIGNDDHLEIWSLARWEELTRQLWAEGGDIADQLAELGVKL